MVVPLSSPAAATARRVGLSWPPSGQADRSARMSRGRGQGGCLHFSEPLRDAGCQGNRAGPGLAFVDGQAVAVEVTDQDLPQLTVSGAGQLQGGQHVGKSGSAASMSRASSSSDKMVMRLPKLSALSNF